MHYIQRFFDILWRSLADRSYYVDILRASFGFSFKYLLILLFLLSAVSTLRVVIQFLPNIPRVEAGIDELERTVGALYPMDLVVTINDGVLATNVKEPYNIDVPYYWAHDFNEGKKHLITIDTNANPGDFYTANSVFLATKTSLVSLDNSGGIGYRVLPFSDLKENVLIDKAFYDGLVAKALPYLEMAKPLLYMILVLAVIFGPILGMFFGFAGKLLYLLFVTVLILLTAKTLHVPYSYKNLYRLGIHGLTLPILLSFALGVFGLSVPFLYTVVFLCWMTVVLVYLRDTEKTASIPPGQA